MDARIHGVYNIADSIERTYLYIIGCVCYILVLILYVLLIYNVQVQTCSKIIQSVATVLLPAVYNVTIVASCAMRGSN